MRRKLIHLVPGRKSGIMHENLHSYVFFFYISGELLIVNSNPTIPQNDPTTTYLSIDHYMSSNKALNDK